MAADPRAALLQWANSVEVWARHPPTLAQVAAIRAVVGLHEPDPGMPELTCCVLCGHADGSWPCTTLLELADGFAPGWRDGG